MGDGEEARDVIEMLLNLGVMKERDGVKRSDTVSGLDAFV